MRHEKRQRGARSRAGASWGPGWGYTSQPRKNLSTDAHDQNGCSISPSFRLSSLRERSDAFCWMAGTPTCRVRRGTEIARGDPIRHRRITPGPSRPPTHRVPALSGGVAWRPGSDGSPPPGALVARMEEGEDAVVVRVGSRRLFTPRSGAGIETETRPSPFFHFFAEVFLKASSDKLQLALQGAKLIFISSTLSWFS